MDKLGKVTCGQALKGGLWTTVDKLGEVACE